MQESKIKFGIAGVGWMGSELLEKVILNADAELVAVFDPDPANVLNIKNRFSLADHIFVESYEQVLEKNIDAMVIASPNDLHGDFSIKAMEKDLHVFCEKPAATTFEEILRQKQLDESNPQLVTFVDYILQFDDMEKKLHQMIKNKIFGEISQIQINYRHAVNIAGKKIWKTQVEAIGMGPIHSIHLISWHMSGNEMNTVYATAMPPQGDKFKVPPTYDIHLHFDNGASGIVQANIETANGYDAYHNIFGSEGWFVFDSQAYVDSNDPAINFKVRYKSRKTTNDKWVYPLHQDLCKPDQRWPKDMSFPDSGDVIHHKTKNVIDHFVDCIKAETKSPLGFSNSFRTAETVFAALVSAISKEPVSLPLDKEIASRYMAKV